jgi:adenylate cyclase
VTACQALLEYAANDSERGFMAFEIERKFLVRNEAWRPVATAQASIRQAYLTSGERSTTRVRIRNGTAATLTIKSKQAELRRLEVECPISVLDAEALMALRHGGLIEKTRFTVPWRGHAWEVDVFAGENAGLVIAEIELRHEDESFDRPPWLGLEITGQAQYYNGSLSRRPFNHWVIPHAAAAAG